MTIGPLLSGWPIPARATLVMEPVIGFFPGTGPSADTFPLYDPTYINGETGEQVSIAQHPGEVDTWSMGFPAEDDMIDFGMYNNTAYNITGMIMRIVGSTIETVPGFAWKVFPDPNVDARFGDVNGDGKIGLSDIFGTVTVSADGRTLTLSGGIIPAEGHFTDILLSMTTDGQPFTAALEGTWDGVLAPEPASGVLLLAGGGLLWAGRRLPLRMGKTALYAALRGR